MFLKTLSVKGFKSFADPTVLELEPGITVVVGPNGSGKSNVVDAVTWVLGAQGPRSLRSEKMEDVIFAGTSTRPPLGRAEVSLTIDNSSGRLPVDMAEVTITRTLFRNGDSEYAINGAPCRLLDIQDLLSDSGVGRQRHMIIGQGQLDTVLGARPEDRRAVIEEAAGVLKHRRRRERAERRLAATQENLERLGDLVREVRRQIRPLERQAAAARSHASVAEELRRVRLYVARSELAALSARQEQISAALGALRGEEQDLHAAMDALDRSASETAAELSSRREQDLARLLGRAQALGERVRGTLALVRERSRALQAALDANADTDVVSTLEAEAARLAAELVAVEEQAVQGAPAREALEERSRRLQAEELAVSSQGADVDTTAIDEEVNGARSRVELLRQALSQRSQALETLDRRIAQQEARQAELDQSARSLAAREDQIGAEGAAARASAQDAHERAEEAARSLVAAQQASDAAAQAHHRAAARAESLSRALEELQGTGGRAELEGAEGVLGSLVDLVEVDRGWEQAFDAAVGAAAAAVVVAGRHAARAALARLRVKEVAGAVLAAPANPQGAPANPQGAQALGLAPGAEPLRSHIRPAPGSEGLGLEGVLDVLVGTAVSVTGWEPAMDLASERPDLVVVTPEGDRFAASGWRLRSGNALVTARGVAEAEGRAGEAAERAAAASAALSEARRAHEEARTELAAAERAVVQAESQLGAVVAQAARLAEETSRVAADLESSRQGRAELVVRHEADARALEAQQERLPALEAAAAQARAQRAAARQAREALAERRRSLREEAQALEVRVAALEERRRVLADRKAEVERRLSGHVEERAAAAARRRRLEAAMGALGTLEEVVLARRTRTDAVADALREDYQRQVDALAAGGARLESIRRERVSTERRLEEVRRKVGSLEVEEAEAGLRAGTLVATVDQETREEPVDAGPEDPPEIPDGVEPTAYAASLADKLAALGPVNPLALEELSALEERHQDLTRQVDDVRAARRELHQVIRALDDEIMAAFAAAAADVNEHFSSLVAMLFPGGTGRLELTDPDDLLNTGVEIEVRPAGRNVRRISLLSGGERSLAALAFLFAVFRSRPSPFYLMDEVEAALDDVNLTRFLGLVREFRSEAQLIIVSHQKRTMETGDALYGVTMAPGGSSQVVSQKVRTPPPPSPTSLEPQAHGVQGRGAQGGAPASAGNGGHRPSAGSPDAPGAPVAGFDAPSF